jgi:L-threonylcarbamoyladenylate synthase
MNRQIVKAIEVFKNGGIVIFPTDTAIGIGCRMDDQKAVGKLFRIRKRPLSQAVSVLVDSLKMAQRYLLPIDKEIINKLINPYWPGGITLILQCIKEKVPALVRGGGRTLGVRMPNNNAVIAIIRNVGVPILGPSANFHGEKTPFNFKDLSPELIKQADYVLNEEIGLGKDISTVIDCTVTPWKIIRRGAIKIN